jgi:hypothetical protein
MTKGNRQDTVDACLTAISYDKLLGLPMHLRNRYDRVQGIF